ncbi:AAA-domain-containing protein [Dendrothele bispora CBS 962.96]|uniref:AAA-domain-containing protein n=1 Tax=Dendrothele bispora (strain CBS 962.96) TaxID=1314807 RepID=A0A4S8MN22_DENBC|nr:AAA-domain-containing protein [Dendrothele bispora CBS 962.96]
MAVTGKKMVLEVAIFLASQAAAYYTLKWMLDSFGPGSSRKSEMKAKQLEALKRLGHAQLELDEYERVIANEIIHPDDIPTKFTDIGGLDPIISSLRESIIYPLLYPHLFSSSSLLGPPKGVLLYGPPGCGKTMLAKALAKESNATFINISASVLANKWFGESNKLVAGLFSLARKAQPTIIFIDEIDSFLRERSSGDHEVTAMMKAEFMTLWDGLLSTSDRILVLGATNRPNDIDAAFLRRMPKRFSVGLPDEEQRTKIFGLLLKDMVIECPSPLPPIPAPTSPSSTTDMSQTDLQRSAFLTILARASPGMSGSDMKEACRAAAMVPVREGLRERLKALEGLEPELTDGAPGGLSPGVAGGVQTEAGDFTPRPLRLEDFILAAHGDSSHSGVSASSGTPSSVLVLASNLIKMRLAYLGVTDTEKNGEITSLDNELGRRLGDLGGESGVPGVD